jgi:hypothetical protein
MSRMYEDVACLELFLSCGAQHSCDVDDWLEAERQLTRDTSHYDTSAPVKRTRAGGGCTTEEPLAPCGIDLRPGGATRNYCLLPVPCPFAGSNNQRVWHPPSAG